jgi:hypothetical protein
METSVAIKEVKELVRVDGTSIIRRQCEYEVHVNGKMLMKLRHKEAAKAFADYLLFNYQQAEQLGHRLQ